ncbi:MAG: hypothetical protein AB4426_15830 [Xenococcaceae cyanobacterium]
MRRYKPDCAKWPLSPEHRRCLPLVPETADKGRSPFSQTEKLGLVGIAQYPVQDFKQVRRQYLPYKSDRPFLIDQQYLIKGERERRVGQ